MGVGSREIFWVCLPSLANHTILIAINHSFNKGLSLQRRRATFSHTGMGLSRLFIGMLYKLRILQSGDSAAVPRAHKRC